MNLPKRLHETSRLKGWGVWNKTGGYFAPAVESPWVVCDSRVEAEDECGLGENPVEVEVTYTIREVVRKRK